MPSLLHIIAAIVTYTTNEVHDLHYMDMDYGVVVAVLLSLVM